MSLSYPNRFSGGALHGRHALGAVLLVMVTVYSDAGAAVDAYFVPQVSARGEYHTNIDLVAEGPKDNVTGYSGLASAVMGWRSQRNITELRPRIEYYDYQDRNELQRTTGSLEFKNQYASQRSEWELVGGYRRHTAYEAQRVEATYDEFDPDDPTVSLPGRTVLASETRTRIQVRPGYTYKFSERLGAEVGALYQSERFSAGSDSVDYNYLTGTASMLWGVAPRTQLGTGVYLTDYDGENADQVQSIGGTLGLNHRWSQTLTLGANLKYEQTEVDNVESGINDNLNNWGVELSLVKSGQISSLRFDAGRTFNPSSVGSRTTLDQVRVQYSTNFRPRWTYLAAVRGFRTRDAEKVQSGEDRDYASAYTQLAWNVTRTWSVSAAYSYYWRKYVNAEGAYDHMVTLGVTYRGLRPQ